MRRLGWALVTLTALSACAPLVTQQPTDFTPGGGKSFRLTQQSDVPLATGYSTTLRPETRWQLVGRIPQGEVYRTRDQVVAVEGAHIHEAYIVVDHGALVGFYLPVERTFSPAARTQLLSTEP